MAFVNTITMKPKAIIFDVDGTLANSEKLGHLPACNEAFKILGLPIEWDWQTFKGMLYIPGTANRLKHQLQAMNYSQVDVEAYVDAFGPIKKELYLTEFLPQVTLREGIKEFIQEIAQAGVRMAIVSTTYEAQIHDLLKTKLPEFKDLFYPILGKENGTKVGPDGMLYEKCLDLLGLQADECLVIEDSEGGAKAAIKAGIPTVVFYNEYTIEEDFTGAILVASSVTDIDTEELISGRLLLNKTSKYVRN